MNMNLRTSIVLFCLALTACDRGPMTLTIGMIVAQTGPAAARGQDLVDGASLAADEINAAHHMVGGRPLHISIMVTDDQGDVARAKARVQELLDSGVSAIIGPLNTNQSAAVIPLTAARGIPQLITATGASLTKVGKGNVLRLLANDDEQGRAMAVFAAQDLQARRVGTIVESSDYGRGLAAAFTAASGASSASMTSVASVSIAETGRVGADTVGTFKAANVDTIVLFGREGHLTSLLEALAAAGWRNVTVLGPNVIRNKQAAQRDISILGLYATATAIDAKEFPDGSIFLAAFRKRFHTDPVWGAQYGYDAVYALADAALQARTADGPKLLQTLKKIDPATKVNQQMRFAASGEQVYPNIAVYKVVERTWALQAISAVW